MGNQISTSPAQMVELMATMSHELRGPLASIRGSTDTLLRHDARLTQEERRAFLLAIREGSERLERVFFRVFTLAQLEQKTLALQWAPVDLAKLLQEIVDARKQQTRSALGTAFSFVLDIQTGSPYAGPEGYVVWADQRYLRDAFNEFIDNALQAMPDGGEVVLRLRHTSHIPVEAVVADSAARKSAENVKMAVHPEWGVEVQVHDQGRGIPASHLPFVFEPFYRVDNSLTRPTDGLGIGLALCAELVRQHGGTIQAESVPGEGSTFSVTLPLSTHHLHEE